MNKETGSTASPARRSRWRAAAAVTGVLALGLPLSAAADDPAPAPEPVNVAHRDFPGAPSVAVSYVPDWNSAAALNNGSTTFGGHGDVWGTYGNFAAEHWAEYTWEEPVTVTSSRVWFWHDEPNPGNVRLPESWSLEYRDLGTGEFVEIELDEYPITQGTAQVLGPNEVSFDAVETDALRMVLAAQPRGQQYYSVAATEWEVWGTQEVAPPEPEDPDAPILVEEVHVRTAVGVAPALPEEVWVLPEYGPLRYEAVTWQPVPEQDLAQPGEVAVAGELLEETVEATVHVVEDVDAQIDGTDYAATVTTPGVAPVCPATVVATFADGSRDSTVPVTWEPVEPAAYEQAESFFDVLGTVAGAPAEAVCTVFVLERLDEDPAPQVSIEWLSAPAGSGWYTELPQFTVTAEGAGTVSSVEYSIDEGETWLPYSGTTTLEAEGVVELRARATDTDGLVGEASSTVRVDATAPGTVIEWKLGEDGTSADFTLTADDGAQGSGVARTLFSAGPDPDPENPDNLNDMWATYEEPFSIALRDVPVYVHVHSQDAAGNQEVTQTVELPAATAEPALDVVAEAGARCVVGRTVSTVRVTNEDEVPVSVEIRSPYGTRTITGVAPGASAFHGFTTRMVAIPAGAATVEVSAVVDGEDVTDTLEVAYPASSCG